MLRQTISTTPFELPVRQIKVITEIRHCDVTTIIPFGNIETQQEVLQERSKLFTWTVPLFTVPGRLRWIM